MSYIIVQKCVYRHKVYGVFDTAEDAMDSFTAYADSCSTTEDQNGHGFHDFDGYHEYDLLRMPGDMSEPEVIARFEPKIEGRWFLNRRYEYEWKVW